MNWIEVTVEVDGEAAEAVADVLARFGHQGVAIEQAGFPIEVWPEDVPPADHLIVRAYFPENDRAEDAKQKLRERASDFSLADASWSEKQERAHRPMRIL